MLYYSAFGSFSLLLSFGQQKKVKDYTTNTSSKTVKESESKRKRSLKTGKEQPIAVIPLEKLLFFLACPRKNQRKTPTDNLTSYPLDQP